jgi:hypothetical protein
MAVELLMLVPGLLLLVLANYTEKRKKLRMLTQVFLMLSVLLVLAEGVITLEMGESLGVLSNPLAYGVITIVSALFAMAVFLKPIRKRMARVMDIDPDNWLHATALVFVILLAGMSLAAASGSELSALGSGISAESVLTQQAFFILVSFIGVGWLVRRKLGEAAKRLGIVKPSPRDIWMSIAYLFIIFAVVMLMGLISLALDPSAGILEGENDQTIEMLGGVTILTAILFSLGAGIGEETLFRGALQPRVGIIVTSLLFTVAHIQYPNILQMATLFLISIVLGYERKKINTTACIITHTAYDMVLFLAIAMGAIVSGFLVFSLFLVLVLSGIVMWLMNRSK